MKPNYALEIFEVFKLLLSGETPHTEATNNRAALDAEQTTRYVLLQLKLEGGFKF